MSSNGAEEKNETSLLSEWNVWPFETRHKNKAAINRKDLMAIDLSYHLAVLIIQCTTRYPAGYSF